MCAKTVNIIQMNNQVLHSWIESKTDDSLAKKKLKTRDQHKRWKHDEIKSQISESAIDVFYF